MEYNLKIILKNEDLQHLQEYIFIDVESGTGTGLDTGRWILQLCVVRRQGTTFCRKGPTFCIGQATELTSRSNANSQLTCVSLTRDPP